MFLLPESHVTGHAVQSLNGVTMQSFLQGSWHDLIVLGRGVSGHLSRNNVHLYSHQNIRAEGLHTQKKTVFPWKTAMKELNHD